MLPSTLEAQTFIERVKRQTAGKLRGEKEEDVEASRSVNEITAQEKAKSEQNPSPYTAMLIEKGVVRTKIGFANYLDSLTINDALREKAKLLVLQLSDEDYLVRERATEELKLLSGISLALLESIQPQVDTTEGRFRLNGILKSKAGENYAQLQFAIMREIRHLDIKGLTPNLIRCSQELEQKQFVLSGLIDAVEITSTIEDIELLKSTLLTSKPNSPIQTACFMGLAAVAPKVALEFALENKATAKGRYGLAIAKTLVQDKRQESLGVLVKLLEDEENQIRLTALSVLRNLTGLEFESNYLQNPKSIQLAVSESRKWLATNKDKAIDFKWETSKVRLGRRLIAHYDKDVVIELDELNNIVWSTNARKPFTCLGLPNGHRYIIEYQAGSVIEFDGSGKEVNRFTNVSGSMSGMCLRSNGNLVIAAGQNDNQIFEIDKTGTKVKTFTVGGTPTSVEIGLNGNLICALYKKDMVVELDESGNIVKEIATKGAPYHATPLRTGNYLVAFAKEKKIAEYDAAGNEIWKHECAKGSYRAQELEDGTIVFTDSIGTHHINRAGEKIGFTDLTVSGTIHYSHSY